MRQEFAFCLGGDQRGLLFVLALQQIGDVGGYGQAHGAAGIPVDDFVHHRVGPLGKLIFVRPLIGLIPCGDDGVGAERAGAVASLQALVADVSQRAGRFGKAGRHTFVQEEQLIGVHVYDIDRVHEGVENVAQLVVFAPQTLEEPEMAQGDGQHVAQQMADARVLRGPLARRDAVHKADAAEQAAVMQDGYAENGFDPESQQQIPLRAVEQADIRNAEIFAAGQQLENRRQRVFVNQGEIVVGFSKQGIEPAHRFPPGLGLILKKADLAAV